MKDVRLSVKKAYSKVAKNRTSCCSSDCGCGGSSDLLISESDLGLSCGNPVAFSKIKNGMTIVDLGSGAGKDVFVAAGIVGKAGKVIGIDMTDEMINLAKKNAKKFKEATGLNNVEFKKGFIEDIPLKDNIADLVISNCVINLSPDKKKVFEEIYRILKPGAEMVVSDIVLDKKLPEKLKNNKDLYSACLSGALLKKDYLSTIKKAGFKNLKILVSKKYSFSGSGCDPITSKIGNNLEFFASSLTIYAKKGV
ncbi:MAG TPA: methyltransferase domain-containing protein [Elusimicrobiales bacterium]|nr:methyltransferase domain-containing protein [Elusimicrobiales bacterium]HOL63052.1 methyltransferase domain-containing protein [Elusimicrobiales bacterium]HPO95339.1 methyltransferase domain-containing protein [Elusimicrobiales bacterium]